MKELDIQIGNEKFKAKEKTFKSLKTGYGLYGKLNLNGEQYQMSINIIKLK